MSDRPDRDRPRLDAVPADARETERPSTYDGRRAERRGRRVAPTVAAYRKAGRRHGDRGVFEALISRHNQRMKAMAAFAAGRANDAISQLNVVPVLDVALIGASAAANESSFEGSSLGAWAMHVHACVDQVVQVSRLILCGQLVGAAVVARNQLERTTANRAATFGIGRTGGETTASWTSRVWQDFNKGLPPARDVWIELSELIHGRGPIASITRWESDGMDTVPPVELDAVIDIVVSAQRLALRQIRAMTATVCDARSWPDMRSLTVGFADLGAAAVLPSPIDAALWPVTYDLLDDGSGRWLEKHGQRYWAQLSPGPDSSSLPSMAFMERRARAIRRARLSRDAEQRALGPLEPLAVHDRLAPVVLAAEAAGLAARWTVGPASDALTVAASSLRSAVLLWLEDDSTAMGVLRTVLEQTARARAHRTKPAKASKVETAPPSQGPVRWLEASGLSRLRVLNACLGELTHMSARTRDVAALEGLRLLQLETARADDNAGLTTARGHAMDVVTNVLLAETVAALETVAAEIAQAIRREFTLRQRPIDLEALLNEMTVLRSYDFGQPRPVPTDDNIVAAFGPETAEELRRRRESQGSNP